VGQAGWLALAPLSLQSSNTTAAYVRNQQQTTKKINNKETLHSNKIAHSLIADEPS